MVSLGFKSQRQKKSEPRDITAVLAAFCGSSLGCSRAARGGGCSHIGEQHRTDDGDVSPDLAAVGLRQQAVRAGASPPIRRTSAGRFLEARNLPPSRRFRMCAWEAHNVMLRSPHRTLCRLECSHAREASSTFHARSQPSWVRAGTTLPVSSTPTTAAKLPRTHGRTRTHRLLRLLYLRQLSVSMHWHISG